MSPGDSTTFLFAINPVSGGKMKTDWEELIRKFYNDTPVRPEFFILTGNNDGESLKHWIEKISPAKVIAVGGDGTVSLVARALLGTGIPLGILPAGSANGMAVDLGLPLTINEALQTITADTSRNADSSRINQQYYCLHLSDIGLNALLIKHFEEGNIRGKIGYATKVIKTLWHKAPMNLRIRTRDREVRVEALMVVLANATKYGTGAVINPEGNPYDGTFEVVIVKRLAISELFKMWFRPQPFNPAKIRLFPATSVIINSRKKVHFQVDGEYLGKVKRVEAEILPGQLKLIVP